MKFWYLNIILILFVCSVLCSISFANSKQFNQAEQFKNNNQQNVIDQSLAGKQLIITSGMQYDYAKTLFEDQDYDTAIVEFKRFIHFFPKNSQKEQAEFNIAVCLFHLKKYHDAARAFNDIIIKGRENNITKQSIFFQSQAFINLGNIGYAQIALQNYLKLVEDTNDTDTKDKIYFKLAQIHLSEAKRAVPGALASARKYLLKISQSNADKYKTDQYLDLIVRADQVPKKNPTLAGLFAIVPGAGFLYCERYHDAFITFLLNAGLIAASFEAWDNGNQALAGVIGFVETGFYSGNIYGSISSAHKYNQAQTIKILGLDFAVTSNFDPVNKGYGLSFTLGF